MGQRIAELQHRCREGALISTLMRAYDLAKASMYRFPDPVREARA
jgi:hypothetical protein